MIRNLFFNFSSTYQHKIGEILHLYVSKKFKVVQYRFKITRLLNQVSQL